MNLVEISKAFLEHIKMLSTSLLLFDHIETSDNKFKLIDSFGNVILSESNSSIENISDKESVKKVNQVKPEKIKLIMQL